MSGDRTSVISLLCVIGLASLLISCGKSEQVSRCKMKAMEAFQTGNLTDDAKSYLSECMRAEGYQWDWSNKNCDAEALVRLPQLSFCWLGPTEYWIRLFVKWIEDKPKSS